MYKVSIYSYDIGYIYLYFIFVYILLESGVLGIILIFLLDWILVVNLFVRFGLFVIERW